MSALPAIAESEYALLATMLFDSRRIDIAADILSPEDFSEPFYGRLFALLSDEYGKGNPLTALTLRPYIESDPAVSEVGVNRWLANITSAAAGLVDARSTAKQIKDIAKRRALVVGMQQASTLSADIGSPLESAVEAAEAALSSVTIKTDGVREVSGSKAMQSLMKQAEAKRTSVRSTIIPTLDDMIGGMRAGELIIGGGRPGMGKTAVGLSYSLGAAQGGHGVLFVSLEMCDTEIAARNAADLSFDGSSGVAYADINSDDPSAKARRAMYDAERILADIPFQIIDAGSLTISALERRVKRWKRRFSTRGQSLDLVVIDYIQLLRGDQKNMSAYETVSDVSRRLKALAKEADVAVFALAQLSREVEKRQDKRPQLSDLKESGQLEQDANAVILFYRHEYYVRQLPPSEIGDALNDCENKIDFLVPKVRRGVAGEKSAQFYGKYQAVRG